MKEHGLYATRIDPNNTTKARQQLIKRGADLWSGECSCGHWQIALGLKFDIEQLHVVHTEEATK